jgi:RNA polymerase sigma-70 factor (ECF subfamily)
MSFETNRFIELLRPQYNDALKYCRALCSKRSADDADDIIQQSFLKALENFGSLRNEESFRPWLFSIITREYYNWIRKDFWRRFLPSDDEKQFPEKPELIDRGQEEFFNKDIKTALNCLNDKERSALLLFETGGFSIEEIKEIQGERSLSAIKSRLSRARGKLRKFFSNEGSKPAKTFNKEISEGDINDETYRLIQEARGK